MASLPQHHSNYDRILPSPRRSTSQMCLHKILTIITTVPPPLPAATPPFSVSEIKQSSPENDASDQNKFELCPPPKESLVGADASGLSSLGGGCYKINLENPCDRPEKEERSLILLIEAAKLIFGEFKENDKAELKKDEQTAGIRKSTRRTAEEMGGELEETASYPVVRSKRGRTRVLPCKYRDSVLEPLPRLSRSILPPKRTRR